MVADIKLVDKVYHLFKSSILNKHHAVALTECMASLNNAIITK